MNIYVGNLSYQTTEDELRDLFAEFGDVVSAKLIADKFTGQSRVWQYFPRSTNTSIQDLEEQELNNLFCTTVSIVFCVDLSIHLEGNFPTRKEFF